MIPITEETLERVLDQERDAGRAEERAKIVAWLRSRANHWDGDSQVQCAARIERGDHLK